MATLLGSPHNYVYDDLIVVRASAKNAIGWGSTSSPNAAGATAKTVPQAPAQPTRNSGTTATQVVVDWTSLITDAEIGGSTILSYHLQFDSGTGGVSWTDLVGFSSNSLATTFTVSSGIVAGTDYMFRVRAKNIYGWGSYSATATINASGLPAQMAAVTTSISGSNLKIAFTSPGDGGSAITGY